MRKAAVLCLFVAFVSLGSQVAYGQDDNKSAESAKAEQSKTFFHAYRVDFTINELEDGKKINSRHYSMNLNAGDRERIKIGTKVPVTTGSFEGKDVNPLVATQWQYVDVGTEINCKLDERGDDLGLDVHGDFSNIAAADEQHGSQAAPHQPIIRQVNISGSTLAVPGKPVVIGAVDDPNSNREFQLEATATRLR